MESSGANVAAIFTLGMAIAFVIVDHRSRSSLMLCGVLACASLSILINVNLVLPYRGSNLPWWIGLTALPLACGAWFAAGWLSCIRQTLPAGKLITRFGDRALRGVQASGFVYVGLSLLLPDWRLDYFLRAMDRSGGLSDPRFWVFATPLIVALLLIMQVALLTLNRRPDPAERRRLLGVALAMPFMTLGLFIPVNLAPYTMVLSLMIILVASLQYHIYRGERGQFLSRFLSPQVASLVNQRGLNAMDETRLELTVVACDLRGFTRYAEGQDSTEVIALLRDYYACVGEAAAEHGATIKDYAGDGVLLLVGAPIAVDNHAQVALALAQRIRDIGHNLLARRAPQLGLGVGLASGEVSVGIVGGERLEYAAVGSAVNLAARLCDHAADGEILLSERSAELLGSTAKPMGSAMLKGMGAAVPTFTA